MKCHNNSWQLRHFTEVDEYIGYILLKLFCPELCYHGYQTIATCDPFDVVNKDGEIAPPINWAVCVDVGLAATRPRPVLEMQPGWIFGWVPSDNCVGSTKKITLRNLYQLISFINNNHLMQLDY